MLNSWNVKAETTHTNLQEKILTLLGIPKTYCESTVISKQFINSFYKVVCSDRLASLTSFIMHVRLPIFKLSTPFTYSNITRSVFLKHVRFSDGSSLRCCTIPFWLQEMNNTPQLTFGSRINRGCYVYLSAAQYKLAS
ncbi:hypothetical protein J6590_023144 [Homalodisca vitripennis]|nr:hypothetical protein J6590_023144 [Homalodisca vitripennis]